MSPSARIRHRDRVDPREHSLHHGRSRRPPTIGRAGCGRRWIARGPRVGRRSGACARPPPFVAVVDLRAALGYRRRDVMRRCRRVPPLPKCATSRRGSSLSDLAPDLHDFGDTAAAIAESRPRDHRRHVDCALGRRDGQAGVDSSARASEYRWLTEREDSPWYPTARLFRQKRRGDWDEVIGRVKEALREWVAAGGKAAELPKREERELKPRVGLAPRRIAGCRR